MTKPFRLDGRRALVTGANTGIGQAIAVALARAEAEVGCAARRDLDETIGRIADAGGRVHAVRLDLSDAMAAGPVLGEGGYDIHVNNAGIICRADSRDFTEADSDDVMNLNLKAVFFTSQAFARALGGRAGAIVNIASLLSFQGGIRVPSYTAVKHGVAGLTKVLANESASKDINVNAIAPSYIATNNTKALRADPDLNKAILDRIPAKRWGDPAEIAETAVFLCPLAARYIHGAVLNVDGGWLAR